MQSDSEVINDAESRETITKHQLEIYGLLKFPKEFMTDTKELWVLENLANCTNQPLLGGESVA